MPIETGLQVLQWLRDPCKSAKAADGSKVSMYDGKADESSPRARLGSLQVDLEALQVFYLRPRLSSLLMVEIFGSRL